MNRLIVFAVLLAYSININCQESLQFVYGPKYDLRLLIVPFDPIIYYNDATSEIAPKYNMSHDELMMYFRTELNRFLNNSLVDSCYTVNLLNDNTKVARQDLAGIYTNISYEMRSSMQNKPEDPDDEGFFKKILNKKKHEKAKENKEGELYKTYTSNGEIHNKRSSTKNLYLHIVFKDPDFIPELSVRRKVDRFLFINQFEIKGNYENPYASGTNEFTRTLKVHFSIYDHLGDLVHGSYASVDIPFYLYDKEKIVSNYFPEIVRQIIHNIEFAY